MAFYIFYLTVIVSCSRQIQANKTDGAPCILACDAFRAAGLSFPPLNPPLQNCVLCTVKCVTKAMSGKSLQPVIVLVAKTDGWRQIAEKCKGLWNSPNCVGSLEGRHVNIECQRKKILQFRIMK
jgi:hypothetical protein